MAVSAFQKVLNKLFKEFALRHGREPQTPKEWMDLQNEAVRYFNLTKGKGITGSVRTSGGDVRPIADPTIGFKPKVIQGGKGIEGLLKSGDVKKGVAPKTTAKTLADKKDRSLLFSEATDEIEKIKLRNKKAIKDFKKKHGKKTVEDFRDEGDWDPSGFAGGGPVNMEALIQMYMDEGMTHAEAVEAAQLASDLPWDTLTKAEGGMARPGYGVGALVKLLRGGKTVYRGTSTKGGIGGHFVPEGKEFLKGKYYTTDKKRAEMYAELGKGILGIKKLTLSKKELEKAKRIGQKFHEEIILPKKLAKEAEIDIPGSIKVNIKKIIKDIREGNAEGGRAGFSDGLLVGPTKHLYDKLYESPREKIINILNMPKNAALKIDEKIELVKKWIKEQTEKAEGGRIDMAGGGAVKKFIEQLFIKASNDIRLGRGKWKGLTQPQWIKQHDDLTKMLKKWEWGGKKRLPPGAEEYIGMNDLQIARAVKQAEKQVKKTKSITDMSTEEKAALLKKYQAENPHITLSYGDKEKRLIPEGTTEESIDDAIRQGNAERAEREALKQKYPGIADDLVEKILIDDNPQRKADVLSTLDQYLKLRQVGKGEEEAYDIITKSIKDPTKHAEGGRAGFIFGGSAGLRALIKRMRGSNKRIMPSGIPANKKDLVKKLMPREFEQFENLKISQLENLLESLKLDKQQMTMRAQNKAINDPGLDFMIGKLDEMPGSGLTSEADLAKYTDIDRDILILEQMIKNKRMKGRKPNASGGLAYMLGEPNTRTEALQEFGVVTDPWGMYTDPSLYAQGERSTGAPGRGEYAEGGGVGLPPFTMPTPKPPQPEQLDTPQPQGIGQPNPMHMPKGIPSAVPRSMDPQYQQQQMMQQLMAQQMSQQPRMGLKHGGNLVIWGKDVDEQWSNLNEDQKNWIRENFPDAIHEKSEGGRIGLAGGGMTRRAFMKLMAGLASLPFIGKGVQKAAPKVLKEATKITRDVDGIPDYAFSLIEVVKAKGTKEIMEGLYKRNPPQTKYNYKGVDVVEDGMGNTSVRKEMEETKSWNDEINDDVIIEDVVDREIGFEIRKGEDIVKDEGLETQKAIRGQDEYTENTAYMQGDPEGGVDVSDVTELIEEADHLELKKIADEIDDGYMTGYTKIKPGKASGGLAHLLGE